MCLIILLLNTIHFKYRNVYRHYIHQQQEQKLQLLRKLINWHKDIIIKYDIILCRRWDMSIRKISNNRKLNRNRRIKLGLINNYWLSNIHLCLTCFLTNILKRYNKWKATVKGIRNWLNGAPKTQSYGDSKYYKNK